MTAEASRSTSILALDDPAPTTTFDVKVVFVPPTTPGGTDYAFRFFGLTAPNNAQVQTPQANFTLTLSINGTGAVTFAGDPITWFPPGDQTQPIPRPDYITPPAAVGTNQVTFTDTNLADPTAMILVSFVVSVKYSSAVDDESFLLLSAVGRSFFEEDTFTSPDPTIINVDPTGSGNLKTADA